MELIAFSVRQSNNCNYPVKLRILKIMCLKVYQNFPTAVISPIKYIDIFLRPCPFLYLYNYNKAATSPESAVVSLVCEIMRINIFLRKNIGEKDS